MPAHLSAIPTLPALKRGLKHNFFLCAYPDSRTTGGITPSEGITFRDTTPPTAIAPLVNIMRPAERVQSERLQLAKVI